MAVGDGNTEALCGDDGLLGIDDPVALDVAPQLQRLLLALFFLAANVGDDVVHDLRTGDGLVGADQRLADAEILHQGMQGRYIALQAAVGLDGDEAALGAQTLALGRDDLNVVGVDLRHHHRDIRGAAVGAVVGDDRALCLGISLLKCLDLGLGHIDGAEDEVHLRSDLFHLGSVQHDHLLHAFGHRGGHGPAGTDSFLIGLACTAAGCGQGGQFEPGVILQQCDEALTDHASRTDNANFILFFHFQHLSFQKKTKFTPSAGLQTGRPCNIIDTAYTDFMITLIRPSCQSSERQMRSMLKKDFWYDLPKELIAQEPAAPRDAARLMVLSQKDDSIQHRIFRDLPEYLEPGDLLVVNNSKVLPARIVGVKQPTGAVCELLLLRQVRGDQWECLAKPGKRMQPGTKVSFGDGTLTAVVDETLEDGNKFVTFYYDTETLYEKLDEFGKMPLPPYITKQLDDQSQYQTVYAKELGSAAAPTAGLHFTPELMDTLRAKGVGIAEVTLHVGLGTFRPVMEDEITDHKMHSEWYSISEETAQRIRETKAAGHRVIAVGTTSCRTLEAVAAKYGEIKACSGNTSIFLYPGVQFHCIDGLITNFHLPESTLIMLVSALYGYEKTMAAYKVAVEQKYRFFSFGDAMLIL